MKSILIESTGSEDLLQQIGNIVEEKLENLLSKVLANNEKEEILTISETAELIGVCRTTLYNYEKLGLLKPTRVGKTTRYLKSEVMEYLKDRKYE